MRQIRRRWLAIVLYVFTPEYSCDTLYTPPKSLANQHLPKYVDHLKMIVWLVMALIVSVGLSTLQ
jgi:hypothetical protein